MDDELQVDREWVSFQGVDAYREEAEGAPIVQIRIRTAGPMDGVLDMTPDEALALASELCAAVASLGDSAVQP